MKKAFYVLSLVIILALTAGLLVACGGASESGDQQSSAPADNEIKEVNLLSWGGSIQETFETNGWAKKFEEETGYKLVLTPKSDSAAIISQAIAQKDNPQVDVVMCDVGPWLTGSNQGIFQDLDPAAIPNLNDIVDASKLHDGVYPYMELTKIGYNKDVFEKNNWAPPTGWADLFRPEFQGKIATDYIGSAFGDAMLVQFAKMNGGSIDNIDPGFEKLKELAPGIVDFVPTYSKMGDLFQSGEIVIGEYDNLAFSSFADKGMPIESIYPEEGIYSSPVAAGIMKGAPNQKGAEALINFMISQEYLTYRWNTYSNVPSNTKVTVGPGADVLKRVQDLDWNKVNKYRPDWIERFNKEITTIKAQ